MTISKQILPTISVIIPTRNEEKYIASCLDSILNNDYPQEKIEIIISDGLSDDGTRKILEEYQEKYPKIIVLENINKTVPYALNLAIEKASGEYIVRVDAHAHYPRDYLLKLVESSIRLNADNVGGMFDTVPINQKSETIAVANVMSSWFGVGNSLHRIGAKEPVRADTVPYGCYHRDVFSRIGLFDTDLARNQDDELNARLTNAGGVIYFLPEIKITYYARDTIRKMGKMFYQYGYYKPLVSKKIGRPTSLRQLVPTAFVTLLVAPLILSIFVSEFYLISLSVFIIYMLINMAVSIVLSRKIGVKCFPYLVIGFLAAHLSYGVGYIRGIIDHILRLRSTKGVIKIPDINR
jgi:glycosyltransferase involved in cell wall biosynthesis